MKKLISKLQRSVAVLKIKANQFMKKLMEVLAKHMNFQ